MPPQPWKKLQETIVFENPWWKVRKIDFEIPSGKRGEFYDAAIPDGCMVVAVRDDGMIPLVVQYRVTLDRVTIEFPAGGLQAGKTMEETALAELAEEVDYSAHGLEQVGYFYSTLGNSSQACTAFLAWDLFPDNRDGDETEDIEVRWVTPQEVDEMIARKEIVDGWSLTCWFLARDRVLQICQQKMANKTQEKQG